MCRCWRGFFYAKVVQFQNLSCWRTCKVPPGTQLRCTHFSQHTWSDHKRPRGDVSNTVFFKTPVVLTTNKKDGLEKKKTSGMRTLHLDHLFWFSGRFWWPKKPSLPSRRILHRRGGIHHPDVSHTLSTSAQIENDENWDVFDVFWVPTSYAQSNKKS